MKNNYTFILLITFLLLFLNSCDKKQSRKVKILKKRGIKRVTANKALNTVKVNENKKKKEKTIYDKIADIAFERTKLDISYVPNYYKINYPNGDVPANIGVCSDVIVRTLRGINIDLQKLVHEDMKANFNIYPKYWGLKKPDRNIDHRRVLNLMTFFKRFGKVLSKSDNAEDYKPGDIVCWELRRGIFHIGVVAHQKENSVPLIVHNIGSGPQLEDILFGYKIIGHYRYPK